MTQTRLKRGNEWPLRVLYLLVICAAFFWAYRYVYDQKIDLNGDNVTYYLLGLSLAEGHGYSNLHHVGQPSHNHFPPGYPFIIASAMTVLPPDIDLVKGLNGCFFLLSALLLFVLARRITGNIHLALTIGLLFVLNPSFLRYAVIMMSEVPFVFFSLLTFWLVSEMDLERPWYGNGLFYLSLLTLGAGYYIRTAGIAVLAGISLYLLLRRKWGYPVAYVLGLALLALPWYLRGLWLGGNSYLDQIVQANPYRPEEGLMGPGDAVVRVWNNFARYLTREIPLGLTKFPVFDYTQPITPGEWISGTLVLAVIAFGLWKVARYRMFILGYVAGTLGLLMLWPDVWMGPRFVMPLLPLFIVLFCQGLFTLGSWMLSFHNIAYRPVVSNGMAFLMLLFIPVLRPEIEKAHGLAAGNYPPAYFNYFMLAADVAETTPQDAVVCARKGQLFYIFSGRKTVNYAYTLNREALTADLEEKAVDYVILAPLGYTTTERYLVPAIQKYPDKFRVLKALQDPETYLIKFEYHLGYFGAFDGENRRSGHGRFHHYNGDVFEGEWLAGVREGKGVIKYADGRTLRGTWSGDLPHGAATLHDANGMPVQRIIYEQGRTISTEEP